MTISAPALPQWDSIPDDLGAATKEIKAAIRRRIAASGRSVEDVFAVLETRIKVEVEAIAAAKRQGSPVWPEVEYGDIAAGRVSGDLVDQVHRRGCLVVRGHFDREQALAWDAGIVGYVEANKFFENYRGPGDDFFGSLDSKPEIYPIYWAPAQMEARQSPRMASVQSFINQLWRNESDGVRWFDPGQDSFYPDRIRRRPPGTTSGGLGHHIDTGTLDMWMVESYQRAFRHVFDGAIESYDPWDAAHRTVGSQYPSSTMCSAFRTFQGWTALSDMDHDQGVLHTVPIPEAMAYLLLRPLLDDVPEDDMCGITIGRAVPVTPQWHSLLLEAQSGIPDIKAGDSVWWHCDVVHSVAPVTDQRGWGNVMYIPAAPACPKNEEYVPAVRKAFLTGCSPSDFPAEHYESGWVGRFQPGQLNEYGRRALGL
jgi:hypothetical protein